MPSERQRILELALESLLNKKEQLDAEIAELRGELRRGLTRGRSTKGVPAAARRRKRSRFTPEERERRSARMKAYWDKWRKEKARQ